MIIKPIHQATCHCKAIQFELTLAKGLVDLRRCNCSMCAKKGAIVASVKCEDLKIISGKSTLSRYKFNTMTAEHYFCSKCGIYTFHKRRSNPEQYAYNVACLIGINPFELGEVKLYDGRHHHPCD